MPTLVFRISSDWEQVVKLRNEITKLENQLKSFGKSTPEAEIRKMEERLASTKQQMMGLVTEAAKAGVAMENDLKRKIDSVTKSSDELSSEIIKQRTIIRETQEDVRRLSEQYSKMGKYSPQSTSTLNQLNKAKAALNEQRYALGELQDQQAKNRLELRQLTREYRDFSQGTDKATVTVDALMSSLKRTAAEIGGLAAIKKFGSDVINATGTMQQLHVALTTILQDGDKASKLISEITQFAAKTPFNLEDVASGAKQLLAYGSSAETVVDELSMLGDVAAGLQIPIGQLIYLYGTLRTQGRAMTVDIRQFAGRGIPIYEELAKVLGVTKDKVGELVTAGEVGFKEVEQAFKNMTSEGGKFNDLMENSAGTWPQRMSNIQDTLFQKLNDFGNKYREVFEFGIGTTEELVEHLDDVISVIGGLIAAYGTYKAALIATAVAQKSVGFVESIRLIMAYRKQLGLATAAQQAFNLAAKSNVYVALLSVLVGLGTAIYIFTKRTKEATAAHEALSNVNKKADKEFSTQAATIDRLNGVLKSETSSLEQKKKALSELQSIIPNYNAKLNEEGQLINNNTEAIKEYLVQLEKQIRLKAAQEELEELYRNKRLQEKNVQTQQSNYDRVREQNPIGVVYGGDAGIEAQRHALNRISDAEKALKKANDELKNTQTQIAAIEKEIEQASISSDKSNAPKTTYAEDYEQARKDWEEAKKELQKIEADKDNFTSKQYEDAKKRVESTEKAYKKLGGLTGTALSKQQKEADKEKKSRQKLSDQLLALQEKNQQAEVNLMKEGTEKKLAQIDADYSAQKASIDRQQRELAEANKDAGITSTNVNGLTTDQQAEIDRANKLATESRKKQIEDVYRAETDAMLAYISEYGTFQQKKLAIAQEYARKIADAQTEGDRLSLEKERDQKLSGMEAEALKMSIDWPAVFGEFGGMFDDIMKPTLEKVKQYMQTDDFRNLQPTDQSEIVEAVNRMEQSLGGAGKVSFKQLGKEVQTLQQSMRELNNAKQEEAEALQRLAEAQEAYENALANGTDREKAAAELKLNAAKEEADNASENTRKAEENAQQNQKTTTETATTLKANMENVTQGLQQLASGGIQAAYEGLLKLAKGSGNDKMGEISDKLGDVFIIGWILSILDILKDGLSTVVEGLLDGIFSAVSGILSDVLSGDLFVTLFDSIKSGVGSILDAITFGGFSSWTSSSNAKEVQATIDRLTDRNESLIQSLDALNDTMKDARGMETVDASKRAREMQEEINKNYLGIAMAQAGYHGSHHSWNKYWGGFTQDMIDRLSEQIGRDWSGSLWDLSPEEMKMLKSNADMWDLIQNTGEGGYGSRLTDKLDDYIDQAGKLEEITDTLNETLTQISFDSMYDSFIDSLMDMEYSAEDAADNIAEYFMRAMLSNKIGAMYADKLEDWYKRFAGAMENDGMLDDSEIDSLRDEYLGYVEEAMKLRDELAAATGYEGTSAQEQQSSTSRGFETMTQDQASELNGRFTALYESSLRQESIQQGIGNIAEDARNIIAQSYLELQQINENTGNSAKYLKDIKADIAVVKQNTSRL